MSHFPWQCPRIQQDKKADKSTYIYLTSNPKDLFQEIKVHLNSFFWHKEGEWKPVGFVAMISPWLS